MKKRWIAGLRIALLMVVGGIWGMVACSPTPSSEMIAEITAVSEAGVETPEATLPPVIVGRTVVGDGKLASPYPKLSLSFGGDVGGEVLSVTVQAGDVVQIGDLLALLDDHDLQQAVDDARRTLDRAMIDRDRAQRKWEQDIADAEQALADAQRALNKAQLEFSETSLEEARTNLELAQKAEHDRKWEYDEAQRAWPPRPLDMYYDAWQRAIRDRELAEMRLADAQDSQRASYLQLETLQADVAKAERALEALQDGLDPSYERAIEDARLELEKAQEALTHARLVAPWDAIILSVDVSPGAEVNAQTAIVTVLNVQDGLRFVTQKLSEQHITNVYPGQRALVTLRAFPEATIEGVVEAVIPQLVEGTEANATEAYFTVQVRLMPTDLRLLPGMTGRVEIFTAEQAE